MNTCKTCRKPEIKDINLQLIQDVPLRNIAKQVNLDHTSLFRHKTKCIPAIVERAKERNLFAKLDKLERKFEGIEERFADNPQAVIGTNKLILDLFDKEAKLTGAYQQDRPNDLAVELKAQLAALIEDHGREQAMEIFRMFQAKSLAEGVGEEVLRLVEGEVK